MPYPLICPNCEANNEFYKNGFSNGGVQCSKDSSHFHLDFIIDNRYPHLFLQTKDNLYIRAHGFDNTETYLIEVQEHMFKIPVEVIDLSKDFTQQILIAVQNYLSLL